MNKLLIYSEVDMYIAKKKAKKEVFDDKKVLQIIEDTIYDYDEDYCAGMSNELAKKIIKKLKKHLNTSNTESENKEVEDAK